MITFVKKSDLPQPVPGETEENRFERIRKAASEKHRKSDTDGTRRRAKQTAEDNPYSVNSPRPALVEPRNCYRPSLSRREVNFVNAVSSALVSHQRLSSTDMAMLDRVLKEVARRTHWPTRASMRNLWPSCCCGSFTRSERGGRSPNQFRWRGAFEAAIAKRQNQGP